MKIEWASSFRSDGSRRRPPPSTMHGWLAKMRGTLLGNESLRSKGMREMKEARALRKYKAAKKKQHKANGSGIFSFLTSSKKSTQKLSRNSQRNASHQHSNQQRRPTMQHKQSSGASRQTTRSHRTQRPEMRPRYSSRRGSGKR